MNNKELAVNTIRVLSSECIDRSNSGHPGIALGAAPIAYTLFANHLVFNPKNPGFKNRDRFVLSAGHGSALYYVLLHLFGYDLSMEDLKSFRQLGSRTPGHPEAFCTPGVEVSTGPLGQGIANAVGMAIAEKRLAAKFNREGFNVVDHYTYALCGDGCLQEGIAYEAASLAGTLKLNKLIVLYDKNNITIEGGTDLAFTEDVAKRHEAQGWKVITVKDGTNLAEISKAIARAKKQTQKPTLIICNTKIGYGSPLQGSEASHGAPLGEKNTQLLKENLGYNYPPFTVPEEIKPLLKKTIAKGKRIEKQWNLLMQAYAKAYPAEAEEFEKWLSDEIFELDYAQILKPATGAEATRSSGSNVLNALANSIPNLFGGSADLGPSNKSIMKNREWFSASNPNGSNVHYGIREHAMAAISNGIAMHGGLIPYCATFFAFSDYMKNAIRVSALMSARVIYIFSHDSIGVGEDGPTHQPIEQLVALRSIPNINVLRPSDAIETAYAWITALKSNCPSALVLSRQNLPQSGLSGEGALKGGYVLAKESKPTPDCILIASGSEVELCLKAKEALLLEGIDARVVSMPCMEIFDSQSEEYKQSVLPSAVKARVCVEAGSSYSWYKYAGDNGKLICIDEFGKSGNSKQLFPHYGFTAENVCQKAKESIALCSKKQPKSGAITRLT